MIHLATETKLSPVEVMEKAASFFGDNLGLEITQKEPCCMTFEGGGGFVSIAVTEGERTEVDLESREWDYQVKQFARQIH